MSYIPTNIAGFGKSSFRSYELMLPDGGVILDGTKASGDLSKCSYMKNVVPSADGLKSVYARQEAENSIITSGTFHSGTTRMYREKHVFHLGNKIYSVDCDGTASVLYDGVPDKKSMLCEFSSKLYLYCDGQVFCIDKDFNCTEQEVHAPLMYKVSYPGLVTAMNKEDGAVFNLIAPRIAVEFESRDETVYKLPAKCDTTKKAVVYSGDEEVDQSLFSLSEGHITFKRMFSNTVLKVVYCIDTSSEKSEYDSIFEGCTSCISYGGNEIGGTRIFVSGNSERPGEYCKSKLLDPLYFPADSVERFGDGCDNVTGFLRVGSLLMIFTESSVFKMSYSLEKDGGFFSVKLINDTIGCDVPQSIALIDNMAVFANSKRGVFTVYSVDESDENTVKAVSGNINSTEKNGLFAMEAGELKKAVCADFDGKYMLFAGDRQYVLDYSRCAFTSSGDYSKGQGRLIWYILEGGRADGVFCFGSSLIMLCGNEGKLYLSKKGHNLNSEKNGILPWEFITAKTDFSLPMKKKYASSVTLDAVLIGKGTLTVTLYGDDNVLCKRQIYFTDSTHIRKEIMTAQVPFYSFSVGVSSQDGGIELKGIQVKVKTV